MAGVQYKTSLFADDVILTLTNSERSLPSVTALLELYGSLTYYKVNTSKSLILDLFVNPRIKQTLMSKFPYSWQECYIPYLGILLHKKSSKLIEVNFPPLYQSIQTEITRLSKVEKTSWGRIVLYKIILLPKIIYMFRTLPVLIPKSYTHKLHTQVNRYIWQNKKP